MSPEPAAAAPSSLEALSQRLDARRRALIEEMGRVVVGMDEVIDLILVSLIGSGHILFEGVPGMAKTLLVKTLADLLGCDFARIQFTPDLLPSDVTGSSVYDRNSGEFQFHQGPLFTQILLADEINRAPSKTQSALLEAMQERQITVEGVRHQLARPFIVMATQNPVEQEGVYRLPEAQLDRFFMRILIGYPKRADELRILELHSQPLPQLEPLMSSAEVAEFQERLHEVQVKDGVREFVVDLGQATRDHDEVLLGASPRALVALLRAGQARALLRGRDYVTHADIRALAAPVLNHRLILRPEVEIEGRQASAILNELLQDGQVFETPRR